MNNLRFRKKGGILDWVYYGLTVSTNVWLIVLSFPFYLFTLSVLRINVWCLHCLVLIILFITKYCNKILKHVIELKNKLSKCYRKLSCDYRYRKLSQSQVSKNYRYRKFSASDNRYRRLWLSGIFLVIAIAESPITITIGNPDPYWLT